jgi:hypothetical protein
LCAMVVSSFFLEKCCFPFKLLLAQCDKCIFDDMSNEADEEESKKNMSRPVYTNKQILSRRRATRR